MTMTPKQDKVTLRDIMTMQKEIQEKIESVDDKINRVILDMESWKIKSLIISGIIALIVSLGVKLSALIPGFIKHL